MCLSFNDFETIIFATIKENLGDGKLELYFEFGGRNGITDKTFIMIEAPAYFEVIIATDWK